MQPNERDTATRESETATRENKTGRDMPVSRRKLLDMMLLGVGAAGSLGVAGIILKYSIVPEEALCRDNSFAAASIDELEENTAKLVKFHGTPLILVRSNNRYHALSAVCTHRNVCRVSWNGRQQRLVCPCHGAAFDLFGNVLLGPAPRPLRSFKVEIVGDQIFVSK
jgi:cytochrome b6-f complex iron-sulfur subunit